MEYDGETCECEWCDTPIMPGDKVLPVAVSGCPDSYVHYSHASFNETEEKN